MTCVVSVSVRRRGPSTVMAQRVINVWWRRPTGRRLGSFELVNHLCRPLRPSFSGWCWAIIRFYACVLATMTLVGILLNRLNVSVIAFRWYAPNHYVPSWGEIVVSLAVVSAELWVFRWR